MKQKEIIVLMIFLSWVCGCENVSGSKFNEAASVNVASWNAQTFFDAEKDGDEYSEFQRSSAWGQDSYFVRIQRLCEVLALLDCDVVVLEEVEKETLAYDIANNLAFQTDRNKSYQYSCFAREKSSSIGNLILSRLPIGEVKVHQLDVRTNETSAQPEMRPLMEAQIFLNDALAAKTDLPIEERGFLLFVCHWKSKSGGEEETEIWRNFQETLLADRLTQCGTSRYIICGDFNRDYGEFCFAEKSDSSAEKILLRGTKQNVAVYSPWQNSDCAGSYFFNGEWEKIDHFFAGDGVELQNFRAENSGPHTKEDGTPFRYQIGNGKGYSDHLPIRCTITFKP